MMFSKSCFVLASSLTFVALASAAGGCAAPSSEESETSEAALSACTPQSYEAALAHYKDAVAWSKERLSHGACESENGFLSSIADAASRSVATCGAFRDTIRTSPWAAPLREALGPSLTLRSLTGELLVIKDSSFQNWRGVESLLSRDVTFWANAVGAYGQPYQVDLHADGRATWGFLHYDDKTGEFSWRTEAARYSVRSVDGSATGKREVTLRFASGSNESFLLEVEDRSFMTGHAPVFVLKPMGATERQPLYSILSECDA